MAQPGEEPPNKRPRLDQYGKDQMGLNLGQFGGFAGGVVCNGSTLSDCEDTSTHGDFLCSAPNATHQSKQRTCC